MEVAGKQNERNERKEPLSRRHNPRSAISGTGGLSFTLVAVEVALDECRVSIKMIVLSARCAIAEKFEHESSSTRCKLDDELEVLTRR